jgi:hypothetical protein
MRDTKPDNGFNEVKIVSEFGVKFVNRFDGSFDNETFKSFL